ncbi:dephospho-CoA kinase [Comamonas humi]
MSANTSQRKLRLGVTGGIGSGKSTVSGMFAALGAVVIDADAISRSLTQPRGDALPLIAEQFGAEYITADEALNRELMRDTVFRSPEKKRLLESILHPLIQRKIFAAYDAACAQPAIPFVVFDIPLLAESPHWAQRLDQVLVVDCTEQTQIARVMQRSQLAPEQVQAIIAQQSTRAQRLRKADWVVFNETASLQALRELVADIYNRLKPA